MRSCIWKIPQGIYIDNQPPTLGGWLWAIFLEFFGVSHFTPIQVAPLQTHNGNFCAA